MTNHGDDCYFFYYSTCTKGDSCPFRHCEAAMGNETVCSLWQEGRCYRMVCKFRHMEIKKNRKEIACYWENQPAGCQKPHCAFHHEKPRFIDGVFVPPNKVMPSNEEPPHEEPTNPPPAPLPTAPNPQLRGVIKTETQENVPSPTHPPVVINAADDDEDEDDQFSEEGEDGRIGPDGIRLVSPRKLPEGSSSGASLNFGVSTLEEIRLRKALKASMNRAGYAFQSTDVPRTNGEKESTRSLNRPALLMEKDEPASVEAPTRPRGRVGDRLGKKIVQNDALSGTEPLLKRSLADRLGRVVDGEVEQAPPAGLKPVRERLGLPAEPVATSEPAKTNNEPKKAPEQIHIKTLEEIRKEKAGKAPAQRQKDSATPPAEIASNKPTKTSKRAISVKASSINQVRTFSEILHAKKKRQEEEEAKAGEKPRQEKTPSPKRARLAAVVSETPGKAQSSSDTAVPSRVPIPGLEVKVKTLEEIRREKAARQGAPQGEEAVGNKSPASNAVEPAPKKPWLQRMSKPSSPATSKETQKTPEPVEKTVKPATTTTPEPSSDTSNGVKVKTFEEIMREKRLRKQQMDDQSVSTSLPSSNEAESQQKPVSGPTLKRKMPARERVTPPAAPPQPIAARVPEPPARPPKISNGQGASLEAKAASPVNRSTRAASAAASPQAPKPASPPQHAEADSSSRGTVSPGKRKRNSPGPVVPAKQVEAAAAPGPSPEEAPTDVAPAQDTASRKSPGQAAEPKVRPKLNVKPSVMKPSVQVKPGQKRKAASRSAVAAVKPLNSAASVEEKLPGTQNELSQVTSSGEAQVDSTVGGRPVAMPTWSSGTSPLREEKHSAPVVQQTSTVPAPCVTPQSNVIKSPTLSRPRRPSLAPARAPPSSSVDSALAEDDFEELMNEFTGDDLEEDVDPGMGEEDLLQELSEMIDS